MEKVMHLANKKIGNSGIRMARFAKVALGFVVLAGVSGTAIAQNMVVRSTGPSASSFPAGKKLAGNAKITLKRLDSVTVLSKSGTRVLNGPGTFSLNRSASANSTTATRLTNFINNRSSSRARTGAVRGAGDDSVNATPKNPNLWFLDVTKGGKFCVANANTLVLWRPDYTGSATANIVEPETGNITEVAWRKGNPLKKWPNATAPVNNQASYQLIGSNVPQAVEVSFVMLKSMPQDLDEAAATLIENGCQSQLDLLVDTLSDNASSG